MTPTASCSLGNFPLYIYRLTCLLCLARPSLPCLVLLCRVLSCPALSYDVLSALCLALSCLVLCCFVCHVSRLVLLCLMLFCLPCDSSCPSMHFFFPALPYFVLSSLAVSCPALSYSVLPCIMLSSPCLVPLLSCFVPPGIESTNKGHE